VTSSRAPPSVEPDLLACFEYSRKLFRGRFTRPLVVIFQHVVLFFTEVHRSSSGRCESGNRPYRFPRHGLTVPAFARPRVNQGSPPAPRREQRLDKRHLVSEDEVCARVISLALATKHAHDFIKRILWGASKTLRGSELQLRHSMMRLTRALAPEDRWTISTGSPF
jgi:hypothetical protein